MRRRFIPTFMIGLVFVTVCTSSDVTCIVLVPFRGPLATRLGGGTRSPFGE